MEHGQVDCLSKMIRMEYVLKLKTLSGCIYSLVENLKKNNSKNEAWLDGKASPKYVRMVSEDDTHK